RIEAHVQLCWLALLLMRVAESEVGDTWRNLRNELDCGVSEPLIERRGGISPRLGTLCDSVC
ncbi:MAG: hypothetical protein ACREOE_20440, partial [Gemmatimonadales bacterium]